MRGILCDSRAFLYFVLLYFTLLVIEIHSVISLLNGCVCMCVCLKLRGRRTRPRCPPHLARSLLLKHCHCGILAAGSDHKYKIKHAIKLTTSPARLAALISLAFCFSLQPMTAHRPVRRHWLQAETKC